jgi:hypothetical protein
MTNVKHMELSLDSASFMALVDSAGVHAFMRAAIILIYSYYIYIYICNLRLFFTKYVNYVIKT